MCIRSVLGYWPGVHSFLYSPTPQHISRQRKQKQILAPPPPVVLRSRGAQKEESERLGCVKYTVADSQQCMGAFLEQRALIHSLIHSFSALLGVDTMCWVWSSPLKRGRSEMKCRLVRNGAGQARNGEQRNEPRPSSMRKSNEANPGV